MSEKQQLSIGQRKTQELSDRRAAIHATIEVLKAKKIFIILTTSLALLGTICGHLFQADIYEANSSLFVQSIEEPSAAEYLLNQRIGRTTKAERIETYMRYLSSDSFALSVAQKLRFHEDLGHLNLKSPASMSTLRFSFWKALLFNSLRNDSNDSDFNADHRPKYQLEDLAAFVKQTTHLTSDYSHFIQISTKTLDPRASQIIANLVAEEFVAVTNQRGISEIEEVRNFVEGKLKETEKKMQDLEVKMIEFKKKNNLISTNASSELLSSRYTKIAFELEAAQLQFEENEKLLTFFEGGQKSNMDSFTNSTENTNGSSREAVILLQKKLQQLKQQKSIVIAQEDKNQQYRLKQINEEIVKTAALYKKYASLNKSNTNVFTYMNPAALQQKIQELKEENEILSRKIATHKKGISELKLQIKDIPLLAQQQFVLENDLRLENENYSSLKSKLTELDIQRLSQKKEIRIDQVASIPGQSPKGSLILKIIFSLFVSLFLGISIIIGLETIDPTVKHRADLTDCGLDFIGDIPLINNKDRKKLAEGERIANPNDLVCHHNPESLEAMAFKYVRARIESAKYKFKKESQIISVSSSSVNEGKSFVVANLAVSLSQLKRSVLLIDCDLRRPSQNIYFEVSPQYGLVDLLNLKKNLSEVLLKNIVNNLDYLPAGFCKERSTEYISSEKFRAMISYLRTQYEYIVIDTPPAFAAVDAAVIASYSDIPILISSFRETKKSELHDAYNNLLQISYKRVYGLINKAIISTSRFHYYGYHSQQGQDKENISTLSSYEQNPSEIKDFIDNLKKKTS